MKGSSSKGSFVRIFFRHVLFPLTIVIICLWLYALVYVLQHKDKAQTNSPSSFHISAYSLSTQAYREGIPSIQYDRTVLSMSHSQPPNVDVFPLKILMASWDLDDTAPDGWLNSPAHPSQGHSIARFDLEDPNQRALAQAYREKEVPFIVYNVPQLEQAIADTFTLDRLLTNFGSELHSVEKSASNRFMYFHRRKSLLSFPHWVPPQEDVDLSFPDYLRRVERAEAAGESGERGPLHYMSISAEEGWRTDWIRNSLPMFDRNKASFFMVDPSESKGINCRFGMRGVSAAVHYDGGRNFIAMLRGRKRYVILPPSECSKLELYPRGHPSARHSRVDWCNSTELLHYERLAEASATEAVISAGEVLYLPSYWFHYIVSQDASIQCNARSGDSLEGRDEIERCGFYQISKSGNGTEAESYEERKARKQLRRRREAGDEEEQRQQQD